MTQQELNEIIRRICKNLITDGCKKSRICRVTLGQHNQPMFEGFIKDKDFGVAVLNRLVENFDYELHIVPVKKSKLKEYEDFLDNTKKEFVDDFEHKIQEYVESDQIHNNIRPSHQISKTVDNILTTIFDSEDTNDRSGGNE